MIRAVLVGYTKGMTFIAGVLLLYRILRFLTSYGVFSEQEEADQADDVDTKKIKFSLTGISKLLVQGGNQQSCGPFLLLIANNVYLEAFQHLHESVLEGCYTFNKAYGTSPWEYLGRDPQANQIFNNAMVTNSSTVMAIMWAVPAPDRKQRLPGSLSTFSRICLGGMLHI